jgi:ubiquinone/menaquinone biosynthesis C-methylase UbiE
MAANFNNSAWFYDRLARLVYGQALVNAQVYLLKYIPKSSRVLIVGGGTGWILEQLTKQQPSGLTVTYVDVSAKMMAIAQKRNTGANKITFITGAIENTVITTQFDVVFTPFLLDNFTEENLHRIFGHIHHLLKPGGLWLNTSFQLTGKWWQAVMLKTMFVFFKLLCGIEASKLPGINPCFEQHSYQLVAGETFFGEFISSKVYKCPAGV